MNAYLLTFGGFLLLGGRLGDLFGHRRLFLFGIALFTAASLACGLADSQDMLVAARAVQGLGGAVVSAVALSLIMTLFTEPGERAKAMGVFGFVAAGGGSIGVLLGGVLTDALDWHWIFLVNLPIGVAVFAAVAAAAAAAPRRSRPAAARRRRRGHRHGGADARGLRDRQRQPGRLDVGADARPAGRAPSRCSALFLVHRGARAVAAHAARPVPAAQRRRPRTSSASCGRPAMFAWFFLSALYLQLVLGYSPLQVGLAFLPTNLIMAAFSLGLSAKLVMRFGIRLPLGDRPARSPARASCCSRARPVDGSFVVDVLPEHGPARLRRRHVVQPAAAGGDERRRAAASPGLASGVVNTAFMMGGALGLAVLASLAASHTSDLRAAGDGAARRR